MRANAATKWKATALAGALWIGMALAASSAAAADPAWHVSPSFMDAETGRQFYNAYTWKDGPLYGRAMVYTDADGWAALPAEYREIRQGYGAAGAVFLMKNGVYNNEFQQALYDPAADEVTVTRVYEPSPNGRFGVAQLTSYSGGNGVGKSHTLFVKNYGNGEVREVYDSWKYMIHHWLPDGRLLLQRYNETEKQNEIVFYDPAKDVMKRIALASLYAYDVENSALLIAYNEPARKPHLLDLATGKVRAATQEDVDGIYERRAGAPRAFDVPPARSPGADPDDLPVIGVKETTVFEATAKVNGENVALPYAFRKGESTWVPIRTLVDKFGWEVAKRSTYIYNIVIDGEKHTLDPDNSRVLSDRLHMTLEQLRGIGVRIEQFEWTPQENGIFD